MNAAVDALAQTLNATNVTGGSKSQGLPPLLLGFAIAQPFIWFFMFTSNLIVLIVYKRYLGFKVHTNVFVYNISVVDFCMSFNMLFQMLFFLLPKLNSTEFLCMFQMELMSFLTTVSLLSGIFATIDRFLIIVYNNQYHNIMSMRNVKIMVAVAWIYSFCYAGVPFFVNNWDIYPKCEFVRVVPAWYIGFGSCQQILSTICEICFYVAIFHVAHSRRRNVSREAGSARREQSLRGAKFMGVVLIVYSLCWTPFAILGLIQIFSYHPVLTYVRMTSVYLGISNSLLNPIVYAWQKRDFRDGCKRLLRCPRSKVNPSSGSRAIWNTTQRES
ncbi:mu-type opioid receptor-like [Haliotis cracherodii]|uniref:mu-type opioid receptor-like n=1 Tax=Haliotis rufescens TaxID=6454 RepID=UPI001EAF989B|nr:mu-type opioid receptor-like [Haliotis rufescens]